MKDFFDLYLLSQEFGFAGKRFVAAVRDSFTRRGTMLPTEVPDGLTQDFATDTAKLAQWKAFLTQNVSPPRNTLLLPEVITALALFLLPVLESGVEGNPKEDIVWPPGGSWRKVPPAP